MLSQSCGLDRKNVSELCQSRPKAALQQSLQGENLRQGLLTDKALNTCLIHAKNGFASTAYSAEIGRKIPVQGYCAIFVLNISDMIINSRDLRCTQK